MIVLAKFAETRMIEAKHALVIPAFERMVSVGEIVNLDDIPRNLSTLCQQIVEENPKSDSWCYTSIEPYDIQFSVEFEL
jgi:hypothetical protein